MISLQYISSFARSEKSWVLADQLLVSGASFITTILAARQLSTLAFGWFASVTMAQLFILAVQNALIMGPYQVLQAHYDADRRKTYLDSLFILQVLFVGALVLAGSVLFYLPFSWLEPLWPSRWWILLAVGGYLVQDFLRRTLLVEGDAGFAFIIDAVTNLVQLGVLFYLFSRRELDFTNCFMVIGLTFIPSILLGYYRLQIQTFKTELLSNTVREHILHGKWLLFTAVLQWWAGNIFIVAAGVVLGIAAFAALRLAQNIFGIFNVLLQAFENYALPQSAKLYSHSASRLKNYLWDISAKSALFFVPVLMGMAVFPKTIFRIAGGPQYVPYNRIIPWLCVLYFFIFIGYPVRISIRVLLLNKVFFTGYLVSAIFSLIAAGSFIRWWGVYGVIVGLIFNQWLMLSYWLFILKKKKLL